jgi:hypothetical protein
VLPESEVPNMASMGISSATQSNAMQSLPSAKAAPAQTSTNEKVPATLKPDTVRLSSAAQAKMMHRSGVSPALIAASLGTNVAVIDGYLNIKVAVPAVATSNPTPEAHVEPAGRAVGAEQAQPTTLVPIATPVITGKN